MAFSFKNDPYENFLELFSLAQIKGVPEHNAMALATVDQHLKPSVRMVLFKGIIRRGFSFYTHFNGRKGKEIEKNNFVAATFYWPHLDQQIRLEGKALKLTAEESDKYFSSRSRLSQIGAWASHQSEKMDSAEAFEKKIVEIESRFANKTVPRPDNWGGYHIIPEEIEFWFGKRARLHERYVYQMKNNDWERFLRSP